MRSSKGFEQELLGGCRISCWAEKEIERITLGINRSIEVHPLLFDLDVRLVNPARESLQVFRCGRQRFSSSGAELGCVAKNKLICYRWKKRTLGESS